MLGLQLDELCRQVVDLELLRPRGTLRGSTGLLLSCTLPAAVGDVCAVHTPDGRAVPAEVIGFRDGTSFLVPYENGLEARPGLRVTRLGHGVRAVVGNLPADGLLGRVVDGLGRPIDGRGPLTGRRERVARGSPAPLERARIREPFVTGQRALDGLLTFGKGQRIGLFAGSGVGKSTLLGEIAKGSEAAVNVVVLVGERGREVRSFLEDCLGPAGLARSAVVVATGEQAPLMRARAADLGVTIAEHYRAKGADVLFLLDSLTRLAMAQRELGLALGEPPSTRGYTPSVFQLLADTVERLGNAARGSITGILTVLVDGDDLDEPIADAARGLLDGHVVLERKLAERGHYPAISIAQSISRVAHEVTGAAQQRSARKLRAALAAYADAEDLIRIGAYARGSSPQVDRAIELLPALLAFLRQEVGERSSFAATREAMDRLASAWPF
jgi:flagellum-specific ATP synthase